MIGLTNQEIDVLKCPEFTLASLYRNALINSNFDIWQRGTSFINPATMQYTSDRWMYIIDWNGGVSPSTVTVSRQQLNNELDSSRYCLRVNSNGASSNIGTWAQLNILQKIEGLRYLQNKKVTVSFMARSSMTNKRIGAYLYKKYGTGGTPTADKYIVGTNYTLTSTFKKYVFTFDLKELTTPTYGTNADDYLELIIPMVWGTDLDDRVGAVTNENIKAGTIDIAQVQLCVGEVDLPYQPRTFEEELRMCQRYYEKSYNYAEAIKTNTYNGAALYTAFGQLIVNMEFGTHFFKVPKRVTPTIKLYSLIGTEGKWSKSGGLDISVNAVNIGENCFHLIYLDSTTVTGPHVYGHFTADAEL